MKNLKKIHILIKKIDTEEFFEKIIDNDKKENYDEFVNWFTNE